jgi:cell division protein FtsL
VTVLEPLAPRAEQEPERQPPERRPETSRPERRLEVAVSPRPRRQLARALVALGVLATVLSLFVIVATNVVMAQQSFELDKVQERRRDANRRNAELRADVARLSSPSRIITEAERLGMVAAESFGFVEGATQVSTAPTTDEVAETLRDTAQEARDADVDTTP